MKNKKRFILISILVIAVLALGFLSLETLVNQAHATVLKTDTIAVKPVASQIVADGTVTAQDTATLHFQTGGKLIYAPFKEGDKVTQGQTIAQLDTYPLQQALTLALNNYKVQRDTFDQTQQNSQTGVLQGQQKYSLDVTNKVGLGDPGENSIINDMAKRILDQNQANLDNSVINVQLANYAKQLATLTAPFNGVITHEDVTVPNQNVTATTNFIIIDPKTLVFSAQVSENDIDFVKTGAAAAVQLNGLGQSLSGTVVKIYPDKEKLANGQSVYQVDISTNALLSMGKLNQTGIATIIGSTSSSVMLIPAWTVLSHQSVWVVENGQQVLKHVTLGKAHGDMIEVTGGLSPTDSVIVNPAAIASKKYQLLTL